MVALYSSIGTERFGALESGVRHAPSVRGKAVSGTRLRREEKRCQARACGASQTPADGPSNQGR
jgi:hypothetical protein